MIGLGIIAVGYPDPLHPTQWSNLLWLLPGMGLALTLRLRHVHSWVPYITICGSICWWGLYSAHLHPALALVFVVSLLASFLALFILSFNCCPSVADDEAEDGFLGCAIFRLSWSFTGLSFSELEQSILITSKFWDGAAL